MPPRLLENADALTLILSQLIVNDDSSSVSHVGLEELDRFSDVSRYAAEHLRTNKVALTGALLSVDMGMSPSALATMIRRMCPEQRVNLVRLAEKWNEPHAIQDGYFELSPTLALPKLSSFVTEIGRSAFTHCTSLELSEWHAPQLTSVGYAAFYDCANLTLHTWTAPNLEVVGVSAFYECSALVLSIWDAPKLTEIPRCTFEDCKELTLDEWNSPLLSLIAWQAFRGCTSLVLPKGLKGDLNNMVIENSAFYGCTKLSPLARSQIMEINPNALDLV